MPIRFLKDREGRLSHHKRRWVVFSLAGGLDQSARDVRLRGRHFSSIRPGFFLAFWGALSAAAVVRPGDSRADHVLTHWMLLGLTLATLGLQCVYLGILVQVFFDYSGETTKRWFARFPYNRTVALSGLAFMAGLAINLWLLAHYLRNNFRLASGLTLNHLGVTGLFLMIAGFITFAFVLLLQSTTVIVSRR